MNKFKSYFYFYKNDDGFFKCLIYTNYTLHSTHYTYYGFDFVKYKKSLLINKNNLNMILVKLLS
jgi:hypothetical protein